MMATLFGIMALLAMIAVWRIVSVPVNSTNLTAYVETAFNLLIPGTKSTIGQSLVVWDNVAQNLSVSCDEITIRNELGVEVATLKKASLKFSPWQIMRGRLLPEILHGEQAQFWLTRDKDGVVFFGARPPEATEQAAKADEEIDLAFLSFMMDDIAHPRLKHSIDVVNVVVSLRDEVTGQRWDARVPEVKLEHAGRDANGQAQIELAGKSGVSYAQARYGFDHSNKQHRVVVDFRDITPSDIDWLKMAAFPVSGEIAISADRDLNVANASLKIDGGKGYLIDESLWSKRRGLDKLTIRADYDRSKDLLRVSEGLIDFGGPKLGVTLDAKVPPPKDLLWRSRKIDTNSFTLKVTLDDLPMDQFDAVWPKTAIPDARNWIVTSMSKGIFTHGDVTIHGKMNWKDIMNPVLVSGGGKIFAKDGVINYLADMPLIENASAEATFDLDHMDVKILSGNTGPIKLKPFTLTMDRFQEDVQHIVIPLQLEGPVPDVLRVLDSKPLGYATAIGLSPDDSEGTVDGTLTLKMPLLDALLLKDIDVKAQAKIKGFGSRKLITGIDLSQGALSLDLTGEGFDLNGTIALNKVSSQLTWKSFFSADPARSRPLHDGTVKATVKGEQWAAFYGLDSLAKVEGNSAATIRYINYKKGTSTVSGQVDLKNAAVQLKDIGWNKKAGTLAQLSFDMGIQEGENTLFRSIEISGPGIKANGTAELDEATGKLIALNFSPFVLGRNNATISYERPVDPALPLVIKVTGESFDMNRYKAPPVKTLEPKGEEAVATPAPVDPDADRPRDYEIQLVKLYTSEDGYLSSVKGHASRDQKGWKTIDLWGVAQGSVPVTIKLMEEKGKLAFNANADSFGIALQGLGFGSGVKGGVISINGTSSADDKRVIEGDIKVESFTVNDVPVLARLLSAVSPFGFMDLITGDAAFDKMAGRFKWQKDDVDLKEVRAAGSVVGINLDGRVNMDTGHSNLSGTLVPFSFMNSILGAIPLLGDVITGGSGQGFIAAAFTVKGQLSDPDISVNPVSLLTPGFLRNIFFAEEKEGEKKQNVEDSKQEKRPTAKK